MVSVDVSVADAFRAIRLIQHGVVLELLAVGPEFRRQGVGAALVNWGVTAADNKKVGAVVESTDAGRAMYERCGLKCEIENMTFEVGQKFKGKKVPKLGFMVKGATAEL